MRTLCLESAGPSHTEQQEQWIRTWAAPPLLSTLQQLTVPAHITRTAAHVLYPALAQHAPLLHTLCLERDAPLDAYQSAAALTGIGDLPALTALRLHCRALSPGPLAKCTRMQQLQLHGGGLEFGVLLSFFAPLCHARLRSLRVLTVRSCVDDLSINRWAEQLNNLVHLHTVDFECAPEHALCGPAARAGIDTPALVVASDCPRALERCVPARPTVHLRSSLPTGMSLLLAVLLLPAPAVGSVSSWSVVQLHLDISLHHTKKSRLDKTRLASIQHVLLEWPSTHSLDAGKESKRMSST